MRFRTTPSVIATGSMAASSRADCAPWASGTSLRTSLALAEWLCRTADRIDPARVYGPHHCLGRDAFAPNPAILCGLLQPRQNSSILQQGCTSLSPGSANRARSGRILIQGQVSPRLIIVASVRFQDPAQMCLAQDNDVVHTFTPDRSDQPFDKAILPRRGWCGRLVPDSHGTQSACDDGAVDPIAVSDHVTGSPVPRKRLGYLTCNPLCCRAGCDVDPREVPTIEPHDDEGIEQVEANGRDNKQVHGGNVWSMITQEGSPSLAGWPPSFNHVLGDARLRDFKPELEQFAVDAWRAPKRIFDAHPADQYAQLRVDLRSPSLWARLPTPIAAKAGPVPTHERLGPDDGENLQDWWKPAIQLDKEPAIMVREPDATMRPAPQDNQLMAKHRVLSFKPQLRLEWRGQDGQNVTEQPNHSASLGDSITSSTRMRFSVHTGRRLRRPLA